MIRILAAWLWLCLPLAASACDVCGIFLGVQPNERRNTIGLFYRSRFMEGSTQIPETSYLIPKHGSHVPVGVASRTVPMVETVNVAELQADLRSSNRVFLLASLPLTNTYRSVNNYQVLDAYGMGDAFAMVRYQMVNTRCDEREPLFIHRFLVGAGVKIPLGRNDLRIEDELVSPDVQLGTGSWDGLASLEYSVRRGRTAGGISVLGRFNSANANDYQLGHGVSTTAEVFHRIGNDTLSFAPAIGGYAEWMDHDRVSGVSDTGTGGTTVFSHTGLRAWWNRFSISAYYQHALLNNEGEHITPTRHRIVVGLTYNIKLKTFNMNSKNLAIIATMALAITACKKVEEAPSPSNSTPTPTTGTVNMGFNLFVGNDALDLNTLYQDGAGHAICFTKVKFYVSNVHVTDHDGNVLGHYEDKYILVDASNTSITFTLGTLAPAEVHGAEITFGLAPEANNSDPLPAEAPLNDPDMMWAWSASAGACACCCGSAALGLRYVSGEARNLSRQLWLQK